MLQKFHMENVLNEMKLFGKYQKLLLITFVLPFTIVLSFHSSYKYNEYLPDHWCRVELLRNFSYGEQHRLIRPNNFHKSPSTTENSMSKCEMYDIDYGQVLSGLNLPYNIHNNRHQQQPRNQTLFLPIKKCTNGHVYDRNDFQENAAMHYNFVCDKHDQIEIISHCRKLSSIVFSFVYSILTDRYGRKIGITCILIAWILSSISPLLSTNFYIFILCESIESSTIPIGLLIVVIYAIEFTGIEYRADILIYTIITFKFGKWLFENFLTKLLPHWIWLTMLKVLLTVPLFLFYNYFDETPQWLLARKSYDRLYDLFVRLNRINNGNLDDEDSIKSIINKFARYHNHDRREAISLTISMQNLNDLHQPNTGHNGVSNHNHHQQQQRVIPLKSLNHRSHIHNLGDDYNPRNHRSSSMTTDSSLNDSFLTINLNDNNHHRSESKAPTVLTRIRLFIKRSTLFQLIFLWSIILMTNELTIDYLSKQSNNSSKLSIQGHQLIDNFLNSLIIIPLILVIWFLINQCSLGRRWTNTLLLFVNFSILLSLIWLNDKLTRMNLHNLLISIRIFTIMLAECSNIIVQLQIIELSSTKYRCFIVNFVNSCSQLLLLAAVFGLYNYNLKIILTSQIKLIIIIAMTIVSIVLSTFITETRSEYLPIGSFESEQLITNFNYWSLAKNLDDIQPSNLFLSLSKWDINVNHQIINRFTANNDVHYDNNRSNQKIVKHMEKLTNS